MQINFYEEFPSEKTLEKVKLINWKAKLYLAARGIKQYKKYKQITKKYNKNITTAYWPILPQSYWISPFSNTEELKNLFNKLKNFNDNLLIDLELPIKKSLIIKNFLRYFKNKGLIKKFLENNKNKITTAQFPSSIISFIMKNLGLDYDVKTEKSLMYYSSMMPPYSSQNIKNHLKKLKNKSDYSISLGVLTTGITGDENIISPQQLEKDLKFVKDTGFKKVIIFRLEGLNNNYLEKIKKFL